MNHSEAVVSISGLDAWLGFVGEQGLEATFMDAIPYEPKMNGEFESLEDLPNAPISDWNRRLS